MVFDWTNLKNSKDAFKRLVNHEFLADIKLQFTDGKIIFAHSFILSIHSYELYQSFKLNSNQPSPQLIKVKNASHATFLSFLRYLYTDNLELDNANAVELVKLFIKYNIHGLDRLFNAIVSNDEVMCHLLEASIEKNWTNIQKPCLDLIARNYLKILNTKSFLGVKRKTLKIILQLDPVSDVEEFQIFETVMKWVECASEKDSSKTSLIHRKKLGNAIKLIRFCTMTVSEFTKCLELSPNLFTDEEISSILLDIGTENVNKMGFSGEKRMKFKQKSNKSDEKNIYWFDKLFKLWYPSDKNLFERIKLT